MLKYVYYISTFNKHNLPIDETIAAFDVEPFDYTSDFNG